MRGDLGSTVAAQSPRDCHLVIDEIGGRFARVAGHAWKSLNNGSNDPTLWKMAAAAGWLRTRVETRNRWFSPLAIRIPLFSIDKLASWLAPRSGWLFSTTAVSLWSLMVISAMLVAASSHSQWVAAVSRLPAFLATLHPLSLAVVFVGTKLVHELSHAVVCRRIGARCADVGVLVLCGVPCPYCDVTDVWRVPSVMSRAAVMLAGIYVELIVASLAIFGWMFSYDPVGQSWLVYLMLVCGVSTLVFNANPLMRYDGYHVLCDVLGSVNLRAEASDAWSRFITRTVGGSGAGRSFIQPPRVFLLAGYHLASASYRCLIAVAIASLLVNVAGYFQLRSLALVLAILAIVLWVTRSARRLFGVVCGHGNWATINPWRRVAGVSVLFVLIMVILTCPMPRYRHATGRIEPLEATAVYLVKSGTIEHVDVEFGDRVLANEQLVLINNPEAKLETIRMDGLMRLASLRRAAAERSALDRPEAARQWQVLQASQTATTVSAKMARQQEQRCIVTAPISGRILPPERSHQWSGDSTDDNLASSRLKPVRLGERVGHVSHSDVPWCRISPNAKRQVILSLSSRDREQIWEGLPVSVCELTAGLQVHVSHLTSISPIRDDPDSVLNEAFFQAKCEIPEADERSYLLSIGSRCDVVIRLSDRSLASDFIAWVGDWIRG